MVEKFNKFVELLICFSRVVLLLCLLCIGCLGLLVGRIVGNVVL